MTKHFDRHRIFRLVALVALLGTTALGADDPTSAVYGPGEACLGGVGGVFLLAEPGELSIEVFKRDRNRRGSPAELRAILAGPDRCVVQEAVIPDDGQPRGSGWGPTQTTRLTTRVERKGVYVLNVTVSQDRYGEEMVWGFATNCPRYVIETARGHKDERHQEPIVLQGSDTPLDICFLPRKASLAIDVSGLAAATKKLELFDADDTRLQEIEVTADKTASCTIGADVPRDRSPWRLRLPSRQGTIQIDGSTRWDDTDLYPDRACWTTDPTAHFPLLDCSWMLQPCSRTVYAAAGERTETAFRAYNNSGRPQTLRLSIEFPGAAWPIEISPGEVRLRPKQSAEITVRATAGNDNRARICHLRVTPVDRPEFTTFATLEIRTGAAPASQPLPLPLALQPYQHENEQFGYLPDYPLDNQLYFDPQNRPVAVVPGGVAVTQDGRWTTMPLRTADQATADGQPTSYRPSDSKIAFDAGGGMYTLARAGAQTALLHSTDRGRTWTACPLPSREGLSFSFDIEQYSGHNEASAPGDETRPSPPPFIRTALTARDPKVFWRRVNDLELFVPKIVAGRLVVGEPILLSRNCIGVSSHSGIVSSVVSRGDKVHVVWGEATDPAEKVPGVPTYVITYDRSAGKLGTPALVGYGAPANDVHNSPSIVMDSRGYLHALAGTHGRPFQYARSLQPNDAGGGWTEAEPVGEALSQTYIGLVCGPDDTLHLVYRLWHSGEPPFPASHYAALTYQRKRPGQAWEAPRALVLPPFSEYSVYYHRLTIDRQGRLFLSYDYWSTFWFYRNDRGPRSRSVLTSADGGTTWSLAGSQDLEMR